MERSNDPSELVQRRRALEQWLKLDGWVRLGRITPPRLMRRSSPVKPRAESTTAEQNLPQQVIVRRGQVETFELLRRTFARDPSIRVIWDRRLGDRRGAPQPTGENRRQGERRRQPPDQWDHQNYLVVPMAEGATL